MQSIQEHQGLPGSLELDPVSRRVLADGRQVAIGGRAFDLLAVLAARPGHVFSAAELIEATWPGRVIEEGNLRMQIRALRRALGAGSVINVAGRGYALVAPAPLPPPEPPARPLPTLSGPLLGREGDMAAVAQLLTVHRVVTVLGTGGMGKTRLAMAVAHRAARPEDDPVWWVDLAPLTTPAQIGRALAQAAQLQFGAVADGDWGHSLGSALAGASALLVLDNAEHVAEPLAALLQRVLELAPDLRLLVTSQQRLQLDGEQAYRLQPLPPAAALQLLLRQAQAVDLHFRIEPDQLDLAHQLCAQLDGIPLALEMAGARLPLLGLETLHSMLGDRLRLLGAGSAAAPPRQRTLQAALEWSHALLSPQEQAVLRRLAVFAAPFRLECARRVAADGAMDDASVVRAVAALADKSLLQWQLPAGPGQARRYRLLETTRLFAAAALQSHGEQAATEARHAQAMAALAEQAQDAFWTSTDDDWMAAWGADHEDFLLGFDHACAAGDAESAATIGEALHATANLNGCYDAVGDRRRHASALLPQASPRARARLLNRLAGVSMPSMPGMNRLQVLQLRVDAWRAVGEPQPLARALAQLASEQARAGDDAAVESTLAELRSLERDDWPPRQRVMGTALAMLNISSMRNDTVELRRAMEAWRGWAKDGGLRRVSAQALTNLSQLDMLEGRPKAALALLEQATREYRALGCQADVGVTLARQAGALMALGEVDAALDHIEHGLLLGAADEALPALCEMLVLLGVERGDAPAAAALWGATRRIRARRGSIGTLWDRLQFSRLEARLRSALPPHALARHEAEGERLDGERLQQAALGWLRGWR